MDKSAREIFDYLNLGIIIVDEHLKILFCNRFMRKIDMGCPNGENCSTLLELIPGFNTPYFRNSLADALEQGHSLFFPRLCTATFVTAVKNITSE